MTKLPDKETRPLGLAVAFANQKGGVGKTTVCGGMAEALVRKGFRVLVIDLDPQGNMSFVMDADMAAPGTDTLLAKGFLKTASDPMAWVQHPAYVDLIAAGPMGDGASALEEREFEINTDRAGGAYRLADALAPFRAEYDFIMLDTPPNMGSMTVNALACADYVMVVCDRDSMSANALARFMADIEEYRAHMNRNLKVGGVVFNKYKRSGKVSSDFVSSVTEVMGEAGVPVIPTPIRETDVVQRAHDEAVGMAEIVARRRAARIDLDFDVATDEFLANCGIGGER